MFATFSDRKVSFANRTRGFVASSYSLGPLCHGDHGDHFLTVGGGGGEGGGGSETVEQR